MKIEAVIFDLAGTTIHDGGTVMKAFEGALESQRIDYDRAFLIETMGQSKTRVLGEVARRAGLEGEAAATFVERAHAEFQRIFAELCTGGAVQPIEGVPEALERLKSRGLRLAATTGFHAATLRRVMAVIDPGGDLFAASVGSDEVASGRPAPDLIRKAAQKLGDVDMAAIANVGDTPSDLRSAANAGVALNIGVLTGDGEEAALREAPHTHILASAVLIPDLIEKRDG